MYEVRKDNQQLENLSLVVASTHFIFLLIEYLLTLTSKEINKLMVRYSIDLCFVKAQLICWTTEPNVRKD
jgi:hypothetical protein